MGKGKRDDIGVQLVSICCSFMCMGFLTTAIGYGVMYAGEHNLRGPVTCTVTGQHVDQATCHQCSGGTAGSYSLGPHEQGLPHPEPVDKSLLVNDDELLSQKDKEESALEMAGDSQPRGGRYGRKLLSSRRSYSSYSGSSRRSCTPRYYTCFKATWDLVLLTLEGESRTGYRQYTGRSSNASAAEDIGVYPVGAQMECYYCYAGKCKQATQFAAPTYQKWGISFFVFLGLFLCSGCVLFLAIAADKGWCRDCSMPSMPSFDMRRNNNRYNYAASPLYQPRNDYTEAFQIETPWRNDNKADIPAAPSLPMASISSPTNTNKTATSDMLSTSDLEMWKIKAQEMAAGAELKNAQCTNDEWLAKPSNIKPTVMDFAVRHALAFPKGRNQWEGHAARTKPNSTSVVDNQLKLELTMEFGAGTIQGRGQDREGLYTINGVWNEVNMRVAFTKQYIEPACHAVYFRGQRHYQPGLGIQGVWYSTDAPGGKEDGWFRIWCGQLQSVDKKLDGVGSQYKVFGEIAKDLCFVCFKNKLECVGLPCGHVWCCENCAGFQAQCPFDGTRNPDFTVFPRDAGQPPAYAAEIAESDGGPPPEYKAEGAKSIVVSLAGTPTVNGVYIANGTYQGKNRWTKVGMSTAPDVGGGSNSIYFSATTEPGASSDSPTGWVISAPRGVHGDGKDGCWLYAAPGSSGDLPPKEGWEECGKGRALWPFPEINFS